MHDIGTETFFKFIFKACVAVFLLSHTFDIVIAMPSFLAAMYEKNGQPFENVVKIVVKSLFIRPKFRKYQTENVYEYAVRQADLEEVVEEIISGQWLKRLLVCSILVMDTNLE